jgi:hypothetical protein
LTFGWKFESLKSKVQLIVWKRAGFSEEEAGV